jgi:hypothetical protein
MPLQKIFSALAALIGWASIGLQLFLYLDNRTVALAIALLRFFTYFTILTNLLAAVMFTVVALSKTPQRRLISSPGGVTAITAYMVVVAVIYNIVLRGLVQLDDLHAVVNESLHVILPILTLLFWILFVPGKGLQWRWAFKWLIYPIVYIIWVIIFGALTGFYPYPFTNAAVLGYPRALTNGLIVLVGFMVVFFILIAVDRAKPARPGRIE